MWWRRRRRWWRRRRRRRRWRRRKRRRRWWRRRRSARVVVVVLRIAAELAPLDAAVARAVQVVHPDLVVQPVLAFPIVPQDNELVAAVSVDVRDRGDAA